jgi:glycosyltransferase involved in cell wall biosynthesis
MGGRGAEIPGFVTAPVLRIGVPAPLLSLEPVGGHGKMWHRVLEQLREHATVISIDGAGRRAGRRLRRRPDVVLADGHAELPRARVPVVAQIHEAGWFEPRLRATLNPAFLAAIESVTERSARGAAHVITPSRSARGELITHYGLDPARVHAISHGVDRTFTPAASGGRELVASVRGGDPRPYVLYAASLHPRKNLATLREAVAALAVRGLPHVLAVAGHAAPDGSDVAALERAARAELPGAPGRLVFMGQPSDRELAALMAGADIYCLPSLYEGFGITVLEAMACGAAVVVSDRGSLPEVVGEAGVVVVPEPEPLAAALEALLRDPERRRRLGAAAAHRAGPFSWARCAERWLEVLLQARDLDRPRAASRGSISRT